MQEKILRYWKDPVWSKVISAIIITLATIIFNYIISSIKQTGFLAQLESFIFFKIDLWVVIVLLLIMYITFNLFKHIQLKTRGDFLYDTETISLDRDLFNKIRNNYIDDDAVECLAYNSFSSRPFACKEFEFMGTIIHDCIDPNFEFLNPNLEQLKQNFIISLETLKEYIDKNTFSTNSPPDSDDIWLRVPREWSFDKTREVYNMIEELENNAYLKWKEFIREGRVILKI